MEGRILDLVEVCAGLALIYACLWWSFRNLADVLYSEGSPRRVRRRFVLLPAVLAVLVVCLMPDEAASRYMVEVAVYVSIAVALTWAVYFGVCVSRVRSFDWDWSHLDAVGLVRSLMWLLLAWLVPTVGLAIHDAAVQSAQALLAGR